MQFVPLCSFESRAQQQAVGAAACPSLAPPANGERRNQHPGKLISENQMAAGTQYAGALGEAGELIGPMVE